MTTAEKVGLVARVRGEVELWAALEALGLSRSTWYYWPSQRRSYEAKYRHLKPSLEAIAREHPEYGYRRTTTELQEAYDEPVNHKVVQRLHQQWDLPLMRGTKRPRPSGVRQVILEVGGRANLVARLQEIGPFEVAYTDFTELVYAAGKAYLIPMVDHATKVALGWALGERATTELALEAWEAGKATLESLGWPWEGMIVHHDQDPVFTGYGWTGRLLLKERARISYALRGAKDNPEMESFNSRFKNENRSLLVEAQNLGELRRVVSGRMRYYNRRRRHSALGNQAPMTYVASLNPRS